MKKEGREERKEVRKGGMGDGGKEREREIDSINSVTLESHN